MRLEIIGIGNLGSELAYTLLLMGSKGTLTLTELHKPNQRRAFAEYMDLLPVANHARVRLNLSKWVSEDSDAYIITAGVRRSHHKQKKVSLFRRNLPIVADIMRSIPKGEKVYIATNPPNEICSKLKGTIPLRECTDYIREKAGNPEAINGFVIRGKGHTSFTPAYAIALRILSHY